ncbi:MAG: 5-formyltetrahydrofolate cyclo-ligase [Thermoplasmata archaeon]|jgi:5-formyltetrahydrofolate cyclo-ligase|nr:MAG: 5-formyltetrahydrofolate cyclo-ligase [Thermoplasmata archaeon]RLF63427.1 MAG: 5-formyltetrahydrofolate cyclo-ligase [Thermoplasmata archaeon]
MSEKQEIRKKLLDLRNSLSTIEILEKSNRVIKNIYGMDDFRKAKVIATYISFGTEVNTHGLIRSLIGKKEVLVPVVVDRDKKEIILSELKHWKELSSGSYGILEPKKEFIRERDGSEVDIYLVPGVAFDAHGNRIGYGSGYYDRLLGNASGVKVGVAYDFQVIERIPSEGHDVKLDKIVTDTGVIESI